MQKKFSSFKRRLVPTKRAAIIIVSVVVLVGTFNLGILIGSGAISVSRTQSHNGSLPENLDYAAVNQVYQTLKDNYDGKLTEEQLINGLKAGLANATGDPYTEYFDLEEAKKFNEQLSGSFSGIGAQLGENEDEALIVVAPISDSPASKAGLKAGDIIAQIDDKTTTGMSIDEAVSLIRGPKGTDVTLKLIRGKDTLSITIKRDDINVPSVEYEVLDGNIGYLQISQFGDDTTSLVQKAAQEFKDAEVKGIVLDLRDDPGGLLESAVDVSELWLNQGDVILQEKRGDKVIQTYKAEGGAVLKDIPTVVLINGGSASASEIVAGALRDNNAATLIGEKTYGKGSVQQVQPFSDGGQLKVTVARWYRPNGQNIDKKGIEPDHKVEFSEEQFKNGTDNQKAAAIEHLINDQ